MWNRQFPYPKWLLTSKWAGSKTNQSNATPKLELPFPLIRFTEGRCESLAMHWPDVAHIKSSNKVYGVPATFTTSNVHHHSNIYQWSRVFQGPSPFPRSTTFQEPYLLPKTTTISKVHHYYHHNQGPRTITKVHHHIPSPPPLLYLWSTTISSITTNSKVHDHYFT